MNINIVEKKENPLLERLEVSFEIEHPGEKTPTRDSVKAKLVDLLKANKESVVVDNMNSDFGRMRTSGYAKVYNTPEAAQRIEREHILARNRLKKETKKEG